MTCVLDDLTFLIHGFDPIYRIICHFGSVIDTKGVNAKQIYLFELSLGKYLQIN